MVEPKLFGATQSILTVSRKNVVVGATGASGSYAAKTSVSTELTL